jgi:Tfp pilus assembly protein FimT
MLVVAVAGLLMALAVPDFARFSARDRVVSAADELQAALLLARQKALARRVSYRLTLASGPTRLIIERKDGETWVPDPAAPLCPHPTVQVQAQFGNDPDNDDLVIDPQGMVRAEDAPAVVTFSNDRSDSATVRMVRTGRIRMRAD